MSHHNTNDHVNGSNTNMNSSNEKNTNNNINNGSTRNKPGFIRVKLLELDPAPSNLKLSKAAPLDPFCAVNIKESLQSTSFSTLNKTEALNGDYEIFRMTLKIQKKSFLTLFNVYFFKFSKRPKTNDSNSAA